MAVRMRTAVVHGDDGFTPIVIFDDDAFALADPLPTEAEAEAVMTAAGDQIRARLIDQGGTFIDAEVEP